MPDKPTIRKLRDLRRKAAELNITLVGDLRPFRNAEEPDLFRRLPTSPSEKGDPNVTTSCTAIMALCGSDQFDEYYGVEGKPDKLADERRKRAIGILRKITRGKWTSSGLKPDNAFTTVVAIRTAGFLAFDYNPTEIRILRRNWDGRQTALETIARNLAKKTPDVFRLDDSLRPNPALAYWLVDGADRLGIPLRGGWKSIAEWATLEFTRQFSLVSAHDDAIMDPVAMAMAACLAERLRSIASRPRFRSADQIKRVLPTRQELEKAIALLFNEQQLSGIWDKFFPMFYYRDPKKPGGANYCFAFEFLEAILSEFGARILACEPVLAGLEKACGWCVRNRLQYHCEGQEYRGWNSAQQLDTILVGKPESWATGVVHMFLHRLCGVLSDEIQEQVLDKYRARCREAPNAERSLWGRFLSPTVEFRDGKVQPVKEIVEKEIIEPCGEAAPSAHGHLLVRDRPRVKVCLTHRRSALLFGPPGTSKTFLAEAVAEKLEWPFVEIAPSHFLRKGLEQIYEEANSVFEDLMDLSGVVVLFDEMDALVQRRGGGEGTTQLDVTRQFLTTSMLPKLAKLNANGQVVFFMATNHQKDFDPAIKRPGRFDLLLCMGPPPWEVKKENLKRWIDKSESGPEQCAETVRKWVDADTTKSLQRMLDWFTFGEMKELFDYLARGPGYHSLTEFLVDSNKHEFRRVVRDWYENLITLREGSDARTEYDQFDKKASRRQ
jgi:hypothetical protein